MLMLIPGTDFINEVQLTSTLKEIDFWERQE